MKLLIATIIAFGLSSSALAETNGAITPVVVTDAALSPFDLATRFYPEQAVQQKIDGRTKVRCKVVADGSLRDCGLVSEHPKGFGFGASALKIAALHHVDTKKYPPGAIGVIAITFSPPRSDCTTPTGDIPYISPERALKESRSGTVSVSCKVASDGSLSLCNVVSESPSDYGFGSAALNVARQMRLNICNPDTPVGSIQSLQFRFDFSHPAAVNSASSQR
jgi:TonB family protein